MQDSADGLVVGDTLVSRRIVARGRHLGGLVTLVFATLVLLTSCGGDDDDTTTSDSVEDGGDSEALEAAESDSQTVSFERDVEPIVSGTCARCHTGEGPGATHLRLETAEDVADNAFAISAVVDAGIMPPWPATDLSVAFTDDWSLTEAERGAIVDWHDKGAPLDVDPTAEIVPASGVFALNDYDIEVEPSAGYDGDLGQPDEYRCLIYDPDVTEARHLEAFEFVPDQTAVVHHAIGYVIPAEMMQVAEALDGDDGQPGWSCFGSSGLGRDEIFLGWAPGQGPTELPEGSGIPLAAGDFLVIQIHYHFDLDAPADMSSVRLRWSDFEDPDDVVMTTYVAPAEIPCGPGEAGPLCDRDAAIADAVAKYGNEGVLGQFITRSCGFSPDDFVLVDGMVSGSCDAQVGVSGQIVSVLGHEHELGTAFRMTLNPDTPEERILLDIDDWDFDWQLNYYPVDEIGVSAQDGVRIECTWDRNLRDPDLEPAYVVWADGTNDEMCFATIAIRTMQ